MKSHKELERLNKAKTKAVNHISHELKTPLAVIQGVTSILKRKFEDALTPAFKNIIDTLERNTERLVEISRETDEIFRVSRKLRQEWPSTILIVFWKEWKTSRKYRKIYAHSWKLSKNGQTSILSGSTRLSQPVDLYSTVVSVVEKMKRTAVHRNLQFISRRTERPFYFYGSLYSQGGGRSSHQKRYRKYA